MEPIRIHIATKINLLFASILLALGLVSGIYFIRAQSREGEAQMNERTRILLDTLRISSEYPLLIQNREAIDQLVQGALKQKDVAFCRIVDGRGTVLSQANSEKGGPIQEHRLSVSTTKTSPGQGDEDLLLGVSPPETEKIGEIVLGVSLGALRRQIRLWTGVMLLFIVLAMLVGSAASYLLLRLTLGRPIERLVKGTERIARGDLQHTVQVSSRDEIGMLADAFNKMTEDLQKITVSKGYVDDILRSMTHCLVVLDADLKIKTVNQAVLDTLGYSQQELLGRPARLLFEKADASDALLQEVLNKESVRNVEVNYKSKGGKAIPTLFSGATMRGPDKTVQGLICVAQDITERKRLEGFVVQSEKMSAVGQLAAGVAHEINNPLGTILGFIEDMLTDIQEGSPLEFPLQSVQREAVRCRDLVRELLTFSRTSKTEMELIHVNPPVDSALSLIETKTRISGAEIQKELAEDLPPILGNANQIQQVLINLASNALDAMPDGGILTVRTELLTEPAQSWVCLRVTDTGRGIPPDIIGQIFEPFFTTKPVGKGTGLGLSLVYEIIQRHSGVIDVQSRPGRTEFLIKFPAPTEDKRLAA